MEKKTEKWRSPSLGKDMRMTVYGETGTPILALPTRGANCTQWEKFGMINAVSYQLDNGFNQVYCLNSIDSEGFLNEKADPEQRIVRHQQYESYLVDEVVPYIMERSAINYLIIAGVDLGGYHAINTALKHPELFGKAIGISGTYNIRGFLDGFYSDDVYYNNPVDYVPNLSRKELLNKIMEVEFRLVSYDSDERRDSALQMSNILHTKFITHELDIWGMQEDEWDLWPQMLKTHII